MAMIADPHFIRRHGAFFRDKARGYTTEIVAAGIFSKSDAEKYLDVDGLSIHPVAEYAAEIDIVIAAGKRLAALVGKPHPTSTPPARN